MEPQNTQPTTPAAAPAAPTSRPAGAPSAGRPPFRSGPPGRSGGPRSGGPGGPGGRSGGPGGSRGGGRSGGREREVREFEQKTLALDRVTRVTAGGKRMTFRAALLIGDKKGRVGFAVEKGLDVQISMDKAYRQAKKHLIRVPMVNGTIPHVVWTKFGSAMVMIKPAPQGTGLKCGGAVRAVLELAGVPNAVSKIVNSKNKINIAKATLEAIAQLRLPAPKAPKAAAPAATKEAVKPKAA